MTQNRRIALNIAATYGRSLYALAIGLFSSRWALQALGQVDYGLYGVVAGLTAFVSFFNGILSSAIGRFYALAVGESDRDSQGGIHECQAWFTTAIVIHTIIPVFLISLGYPIGVWAVQSILTIPPDRVSACLWVWRFVSISCFLGMLSIPFNAMYMAKQYIAELTIYSFITTTLNAAFLYYMVTHPGIWLTKYAFCQLIIGVMPNVIIATRACCLFKECRIRLTDLHLWRRILSAGAYSFWNAWGCFGGMLREQGVAVLVNKYFGPKVNAGVAVGTSLSMHCNSLSASLIGAFSPAIYNAWGAREFDRARSLAYQVCKLGTLFVLIFAIPLILEVDEVLRLWLVSPPRYAGEFCLFILAMNIVDKMAVGHMICVNANGRIAWYQAFLGTTLIMALPLGWFCVGIGYSVCSIGWSLVITMCICAFGRIWFAKRLVGMDIRLWLMTVLIPLVLISAVAMGAGCMSRLFLKPSFIRVCTTTILVQCVLLSLAWRLILNDAERAFVRGRFSKLFE